MADNSAHNSDAILAAARASLNDQRAGGRRVTGRPIGQRSAALRRSGQKRKAAALALSVVVAIMLVNLVIGLISGVLHLLGWLSYGAVAAVLVGVIWMLMRDRAVPVPSLETLRAAPARQLVGQTQVWLEAQRPALPAPALDLVGRIGGQLDGLALQLDRVDENAPAVGQVRQLVGEHLPSLVNAYTAVPPSLRGQAHAGSSPDQQLSESLTRLSGELDSVTRQLAEGKLDALAIQSRFIDYKYGETPEG
ncbi:hypothetical protein [Novosphingobium sp. KACC 22771]|uniref:hypothetical protein n=1 Tax=Novosphingobium sp. KACC 22771 TaxID=3025670 RepID=UPI002364FD85|nr:hypothetical protein [Novosphingobium sp. KACC 22771]WDF73418.1 hypothetical protein PQ467_05070 [Novosphingobium sp. KACC 22771]